MKTGQYFQIVGWHFITTILILFFIGTFITIEMFFYGLKNVDYVRSLGPWGDFIAGTLNPILTFFTFLGVLITIILQKIELSLSRTEMQRSADALETQANSIEQQNFEVAFFQMLSLHNSVVNAIDIHNNKGQAIRSDRDCFRIFYTRLRSAYKIKKSEQPNPSEIALNNIYRIFWKDHKSELARYFRFLFNFVRLIDETAISKPYHIKLLRSQLSDHELLLLFYNCLSEDGIKFIPYAERYAIFDNLPKNQLPEPDHANLMSERVFGTAEGE
jgi:hypothetical protein